MNRINIKPLSVNRAWKGRRYKTDEYKQYTYELLMLLPRDIKIPKGKLSVYYKFGYSSKSSDIDNGIKQFQDILCEAYEFNDKQIYKMIVEKVDTKKGEEFIDFRINTYL